MLQAQLWSVVPSINDLLMTPTHYDFLCLRPDASIAEIKQAYIDKIKVFHPDKNPGCEFSAMMTVYANAAYEILGNRQKKKVYDEEILSRYLNYLIDQKFIRTFFTTAGNYHRLHSPSKFEFPTAKIDLLTRAYLPGEEKGGLFLFRPEWKDSTLLMVLEEVVFLENTSHNPGDEFCYNIDAFNREMTRALHYRLLPCFFHSHPTAAADIIDEHHEYYFQMDTSYADKIATQATIFPGLFNLRLPEFLVIANGITKSGLFIGIYGGLIAPLDFKERKKQLTDQFQKMVVEDISGWVSKPNGRLLASAVGLGLLVLAWNNPKQIKPTLRLIRAVTPQIAYTTDQSNIFLGISYGSAMSINVPPINDAAIHTDEANIRSRQSNIRPGPNQTL
jgi:hypothetical protein